jgi:hypothetical protein
MQAFLGDLRSIVLAGPETSEIVKETSQNPRISDGAGLLIGVILLPCSHKLGDLRSRTLAGPETSEIKGGDLRSSVLACRETSEIVKRPAVKDTRWSGDQRDQRRRPARIHASQMAPVS